VGETLEILAGLWSGEPVHFEGAHRRIDGGRQLPVPSRPIPVVVGGTGPRTMELVARHADWWNVPGHQVDRLEAMRPAAGGARVSLQQAVTLVADEATRDQVVDLARRRFGWMSSRAVGTAPELADHFAGLEARGVERVYTWFTDFAPPETLAHFGAEVIAGR